MLNNTVIMVSQASARASAKKKWKRVVLSVEDKVKILDLVDKSFLIFSIISVHLSEQIWLYKHWKFSVPGGVQIIEVVL